MATLEDLAKRVAPHLEVISSSHPEPAMRSHNVVGITRDEIVAREAVISLESDEDEDSHIGIVVLSSDPQRSVGDTHIDPEHVTGFVGRRALFGGLIGAAIGAVLLGGVVAIMGATAGQIAGAALGGAMFAGAIGGIYAAMAKMGGSDAYRQTFVPPEIADLAMVTLHTNDAELARRARLRLGDHAELEVVELDDRGRALD
jgi:hypothetical protein